MPIGSEAVLSVNNEAPSRTGARSSGLKPTRRRVAPFVELRKDRLGSEEAAGARTTAATAFLHRPLQRAFDRRRRVSIS